MFGVNCVSAPFIKPCAKSDSACIQASARAAIPYFITGVPELGISSLDPLKLAVIKGDQEGLRLTFTNTVVTGLRDAAIEDIKQDAGKLTVTARSSVALRGDYTLGGRLLLFPIRGEGKYNIKIQDIVIKSTVDLKSVEGADGKPHWNITKWRHSYRVHTGAQFDFDNLFNGNKFLATPVHEFVNLNWREVMQEVAPPIVRAIVAVVIDNIRALFNMVPIDELQLS
ncbi:hypothetical protein evm_006118 [Chilo suppressalis]|nr:hypothetical protein evm_006118 [Chilo suppressalis]